VAIQVDYRPVTTFPAAERPERVPAVLPGTPARPLVISGDFEIHRFYAAAHAHKLTGLRSNTAYTVTVTATTRDNRTATAQTAFTTLKQRLRVTLREITITNDGDGFLSGDGEALWTVGLDWAGGAVAGCFPNTDVGFGGVCQHGSYGEGRIFPLNNHGQTLVWLFAEENFDRFPDALTIRTTADEDDWVPGVNILECAARADCAFPKESDSRQWHAPRGLEWASTPIRLTAFDNPLFESFLTFTVDLFHDNLSYPSERNAPSSTWRSPFGR
jgi:hypothetical protein